MTRPLRATAWPLVRCATAAMALWRALDARDLMQGTAVGLAAGALAGLLLARHRRGIAALGAAAGAAAILVAGNALVSGDPAGVTAIPRDIARFLSVGVPAAGLDRLAVAPYAIVAASTTGAVAAANRGRQAWSLAASFAGLVASVVAAGPVGVPPAVPAVFCAVVLVDLLVTSRLAYSELPPLIGASTVVRRTQHWSRPVVIAAIAFAAAFGAVALPHPATFDVRRFVRPDVVDAPDDNPLAVAARLLTDPPSSADLVDAIVTVAGPSPGRLRMAVLDRYEPEGWQQQATFAVTGSHLVRDRVVAPPRHAARSTVRLVDAAGSTGLRATPTAGTPVALDDPRGLRFSATAGVILADSGGAGATVGYDTIAAAATRPAETAGVPAGVDRALDDCVDSPLLRDVATTLTTGLDAPLARLDAIGAWLKARHVYDLDAPGGQTIGSVERFVGQEFSRGNIEVFVTAFALLARCAGVPVRVVVGYPAPPGDAAVELRPTDLTAWAEVPLAGVGWFPVDPVPTPQEIDAAISLAEADPPPPPPDAAPAPTTVPPIVVDPAPIDRGTDPWPTLALAATIVLAIALVALAAAAWFRRRTIARRARVARPADAVVLAWTSVMERFVDLGEPLGAHLTATETAWATTGRVPMPVTNMLGELAGLVDRARFGDEADDDGAGGAGDDTAGEDRAGLAWALADESLARLPTGRRVRLGPLRHPGRAWARARLAHGMPRRGRRWTGVVPEWTSVLDDPGLPAVPGYELDSRIGSGPTAAVYRARTLPTGRDVAIKVFRVSTGAAGFDHQRFVWEARVAEMVSGRPNLPEVIDSGFTAAGQPYLATKLYRHGTLRRRVDVAGPMPAAAVRAAGLQLVGALELLHEHGIVHGDVKPENVFVDDDDSLVLGDLGTAWSHGRRGWGGAVTPAYAAPEVWLGNAPTPSSDLYSLGLTLLFAATGVAPTVGARPDDDEIESALGGPALLGLFEVDAHRRVRSAREARRLFEAAAADEEAGRSPLPPPSFTVRSP